MFNNIGHKLIEKDYVHENYVEELEKREREFPTGISTESFDIAIPHVDSKFVKVNTLYLLTSQQGIEFEDSEDEKILKSKIIFGIIIKDHNSHIDFLVKISNIVQNKDVLKQIHSAQSKNEIINLLSNQLELIK